MFTIPFSVKSGCRTKIYHTLGQVKKEMDFHLFFVQESYHRRNTHKFFTYTMRLRNFAQSKLLILNTCVEYTWVTVWIQNYIYTLDNASQTLFSSGDMCGRKRETWARALKSLRSKIDCSSFCSLAQRNRRLIDEPVNHIFVLLSNGYVAGTCSVSTSCSI